MRTLLGHIGALGLLLLACSGNGTPTGDVARGGATAAGASGTTGGSVATSGGSTTVSVGGNPSAGSTGLGGASGGTNTLATGGSAGSSQGSGGTSATSLGGAGAALGGSTSATTGGTAIALGGAPGGGASSGGTTTRGGAPNGGAANSLKDKYASLFPIGAAVDAESYTTHSALLTKHFNSITPENDMKFEVVQPREGSFDYAAADRIVDYAVRNNMKVRGHAFVWHSQNPSWLFTNASGGTVSPEVLLQRMKSHIDAVGKHFGNKVYAWDVVNEAIMNDGKFRGPNEPEGQKSRWFEILGERYIAEAFRFAHAAVPDAKLYYNDFYNYIPEKQQAIYEMLKKLLADGVPVHGVGLQCHINIEPSTDPTNQAYYQHVTNMEKAIELYGSLGLDVQVTEMDVSLYIPGIKYEQAMFYTEAKFTAELKARQAERYRAFFELFRKHSKVITGVTLWGIADDNTWLSEFDSGRKDFPLLFDDRHRLKPAYDAVATF